MAGCKRVGEGRCQKGKSRLPKQEKRREQEKKRGSEEEEATEGAAEATKGKAGKGEPAGKVEGAETREEASDEVGIPSIPKEINPSLQCPPVAPKANWGDDPNDARVNKRNK